MVVNYMKAIIRTISRRGMEYYITIIKCNMRDSGKKMSTMVKAKVCMAMVLLKKKGIFRNLQNISKELFITPKEKSDTREKV